MPPYSYITLSIVWINIIFHLFLHLVLRNIAVISACKVLLYAWYPTNRPQIALQHRVRVWVSEMSNNSKFDFILSTLSIQNVDQSTKTKHCLVVPLAIWPVQLLSTTYFIIDALLLYSSLAASGAFYILSACAVNHCQMRGSCKCQHWGGQLYQCLCRNTFWEALQKWNSQ